MNMKKYKFDERNGLWYELQGDSYSPCLKLSEKEQTNCKPYVSQYLFTMLDGIYTGNTPSNWE